MKTIKIIQMKKEKFKFSKSKNKEVEGMFEGGNVTQDAGLLIAKEIDKNFGFTNFIADKIEDSRNKSYIVHEIKDMLKQRVYGLIGGYEDLNDHILIRKDAHFQTLVGQDKELASSATLSRFENSMNKKDISNLFFGMIENFVARIEGEPEKIVLDFDPTDCLIYGKQEERSYHGYYKDYCFLPLHVFSGDELVTTLLRPSNIDGAKYAGAILRIIVSKIRERWPNMRVIFRGDCAFARKHIFHWCENNNVEYIVGIGANKVLQGKVKEKEEELLSKQKESECDQKGYMSFEYKAGSWKEKRRIIAKVEASARGINRRFLVTNNLDSPPKEVYENEYCPRGDMENKIKQLKLDLKADRLSCHSFLANQFRNFLAGLAYVILTAVRKKLLQGTELANAYCGRIMLKLFKIGAVIIEKKTKIRYLFSSNFPFKELFVCAMKRLVPE